MNDVENEVIVGHLASLSCSPASVRNTAEMQARNVAVSLLVL